MAANLILPALVGCTLKVALPVEPVSFEVITTPAPEAVTLAPDTACPVPSLTVIVMVAVVPCGITVLEAVGTSLFANASGVATDQVPWVPCESIAWTCQYSRPPLE